MPTKRFAQPRRLFAAGLFALALPLLADAAPAKRPPPCPEIPPPAAMPAHPGQPPEELLPPHLAMLKLSDAQRDRIFDILYAQMPTRRNLGKTLQQAHADLAKLSSATSFDEAAARALAERIGKASGELAFQHASTEQRINAVLTPEQRKQLTEVPPPPPHGEMPPRH